MARSGTAASTLDPLIWMSSNGQRERLPEADPSSE
jgi:hypothetical protein